MSAPRAAPLPAGQPASCPEIEIAASKLGDFEEPGGHRVRHSGGTPRPKRAPGHLRNKNPSQKLRLPTGAESGFAVEAPV